MRDEDIIGLDISMDHTSFVEVGYSSCNLKEDLSNLIDLGDLRSHAFVNLSPSSTLL